MYRAYIPMYLCTYVPTYRSIYPSIHLSIYQSIHLSIYPSIHLPIYLCMYVCMHVMHLCMYLCIYVIYIISSCTLQLHQKQNFTQGRYHEESVWEWYPTINNKRANENDPQQNTWSIVGCYHFSAWPRIKPFRPKLPSNYTWAA